MPKAYIIQMENGYLKRIIIGVMLATWMTAQLYAAQSEEAPTTIRHYQKEFRYHYHVELLDLVLSVTQDTFGPYRLEAFPETGKEVSEARGLELLKQGTIDVVFLSTSVGREESFRPVRVPLLRGLLGFRLLLINEDEQARFARVETLEQLRTDFLAGFNPHWVDYGIYKANGFNLVSSVQYEVLFLMLARERFDYIPRGANEVWQELDHFQREYPSLAVEETLALYYPYPVYFFVREDNDALYERLHAGLEIIQQDGRFGQLLEKHYQDGVNRARFNSRRLFLLDNPDLPEATPEIDMNWWLEQSPPEAPDA